MLYPGSSVAILPHLFKNTGQVSIIGSQSLNLKTKGSPFSNLGTIWLINSKWSPNTNLVDNGCVVLSGGSLLTVLPYGSQKYAFSDFSQGSILLIEAKYPSTYVVQGFGGKNIISLGLKGQSLSYNDGDGSFQIVVSKYVTIVLIFGPGYDSNLFSISLSGYLTYSGNPPNPLSGNCDFKPLPSLNLEQLTTSITQTWTPTYGTTSTLSVKGHPITEVNYVPTSTNSALEPSTDTLISAPTDISESGSSSSGAFNLFTSGFFNQSASITSAQTLPPSSTLSVTPTETYTPGPIIDFGNVKVISDVIISDYTTQSQVAYEGDVIKIQVNLENPEKLPAGAYEIFAIPAVLHGYTPSFQITDDSGSIVGVVSGDASNNNFKITFDDSWTSENNGIKGSFVFYGYLRYQGLNQKRADSDFVDLTEPVTVALVAIAASDLQETSYLKYNDITTVHKASLPMPFSNIHEFQDSDSFISAERSVVSSSLKTNLPSSLSQGTIVVSGKQQDCPLVQKVMELLSLLPILLNLKPQRLTRLSALRFMLFQESTLSSQ